VYHINGLFNISRDIKSYQLEGVEVWESQSIGMHSRTESAFVWAFEKPGKFRLETKSPAGNLSTTVSNGESIVSYRQAVLTCLCLSF
jgi:outer membrane lipoprotein-sorting protein